MARTELGFLSCVYQGSLDFTSKFLHEFYNTDRKHYETLLFLYLGASVQVHNVCIFNLLALLLHLLRAVGKLWEHISRTL